MRFLLGYSCYASAVDTRSWVEAWLARLRSTGINVDGFCLTLNPPGPCLSWRELDARWRRGDRELLNMYCRLLETLDPHDVFVNWNGINLHPEFVQQIPAFKVFGCFDDPESSEDLSKPAAWAYDLAMVGNVAELESYREWGVKNVHLWPLGFRHNEYDPSLTREKILTGARDVDVALLCERTTGWRAERLDRFVAAFPRGIYHGRGWPRGFLPEEQRIPLMQRTKIGPNFHNSTGPINFRTFVLPANGVMQLCDNKSHLGQLYEVGKEVVGFETVEEAIDLCRYYLAHDEERRQIAAAGWERATRDYNEEAVFRRMINIVAQYWHPEAQALNSAVPFLENRRRKTKARRIFHTLFVRPFVNTGRLIVRVLKILGRKAVFLRRR